MSKGGGQKSTSTSGFQSLSPELKQAFTPLATQAINLTNPAISGNIERFTPMGMTADEAAAFGAIRQGFAPTAESINADVSMLMNPYNEFVIDEINRQAGGQSSLLNQALEQAGQFGSNRQVLGASDIDRARTNQIGSFLSDQYNRSLDSALNRLPQSRALDAQGLLSIGQFERGLDEATRQAPISALQTGTGFIAPFTGGTTVQSGGGNGIGGMLSGLGGLAYGLGEAGLSFSDTRLKENITHLGQEKGYPIYMFNYKGDDKKYIGVMAQDVEEIMPEAVTEQDGYKMVNYDMIGIPFKEAKEWLN